MVATGTPGIPPKGGGGLERVIYEPTKALSKLGHGVTLIDTASIEERDLEADLSFCEVIRVRHLNLVKLHSLPFKYLLHEFVRQISLVFYALALIPTMTRSCCSCKYDIIHVHNRYSYILQAHGSLPRIGAWRKLKWFYNTLFGYKLLRGASRVIALSRVEAEQYRRMGVPEEKIAIIPNGIDLSEYASLPPEGSFKKKFGIKEKEKIVLYLGRIHKIKGIDILVKAFANVIKKLDSVRLVVVGPDDGYLSELQALIKALRIEDNVLITGPLYGWDKLKAYVDADVYVLPSRYEIWGIARAQKLRSVRDKEILGLMTWKISIPQQWLKNRLFKTATETFFNVLYRILYKITLLLV